MIRKIDVEEGVQLGTYERYASLTIAIAELRRIAEVIAPKLKARKIWMVNSTEKGGGVAEMMPRLISLMRQIGVDIDWLVMGNEEPAFFDFTKKLHNLIHGVGDPAISGAEKEIYDKVNAEHAAELIKLIRPGDIVIIHDSQPLGMLPHIKKQMEIPVIWRCHIGYEHHVKQTGAARSFMRPYLKDVDSCVFSAPEYIPSFLGGKSSIIYPSIDPLTHKNRDLPVHKLVGVLCNSGIIHEAHPIVSPPYDHKVKRMQPDGKFGAPGKPDDIPMMYSPTIIQISRWDKLKGFIPLMHGFQKMKEKMDDFGKAHYLHHTRLSIARLILAGPEPDAIQDDPEALEYLETLKDSFLKLPKKIQKYVIILSLPMDSIKQNALIVNSLQRSATLVVQNSVREGFGLTATEAMWKVKPVMIGNTTGLRQQVRDELDGKIVHDPTDPLEIAETLNYMLKNPKKRDVWGYSGQRQVIDKFLSFAHIQSWLRELDRLDL